MALLLAFHLRLFDCNFSLYVKFQFVIVQSALLLVPVAKYIFLAEVSTYISPTLPGVDTGATMPEEIVGLVFNCVCIADVTPLK